MQKRLLALIMALMLSMTALVGLAAEATPTYFKKAVKARALYDFSLVDMPHSSASSVKEYAKGDEVYVKTIGTAYSEVVVDAKTTGWVLTGYLSFTEEAMDAGSMLAYASANGNVVTLRKKASGGSTSLGKFTNGTVFAVLERGDDDGKSFSKVAINGKAGYILTKLLTFTDPVEAKGFGVVQDPEKPEKKSVVMLRYEEKKANKNIIDRIKAQTQVVLLEEGDEYHKIEVHGKVGFMVKDYITLDTSIEPASQPTEDSAVSVVVVPQITVNPQGADDAGETVDQTGGEENSGAGGDEYVGDEEMEEAEDYG